MYFGNNLIDFYSFYAKYYTFLFFYRSEWRYIDYKYFRRVVFHIDYSIVGYKEYKKNKKNEIVKQ